jgi:hypothetical protein
MAQVYPKYVKKLMDLFGVGLVRSVLTDTHASSLLAVWKIAMLEYEHHPFIYKKERDKFLYSETATKLKLQTTILVNHDMITVPQELIDDEANYTSYHLASKTLAY